MPHAPSLRLYFLGAFHIERDERLIALPTRKVESLLAYVALFPQEHAREKLAALFWGDSTDEQARHSLRTALATLRSKLGDDILLADRETVQLNPDSPLWVDTKEFQEIRDQKLEIGNLQSLISLYQGDLLPDFYDDWVLVERERLRQLYLDTLLRLTQEMRSQSQYTRAVEFARRVLATEPTNEAAYQHLMFCCAATGDRIGALKQYDECEKRLRDELGVEPSSETTTLREQIERELTGAPSHEALLTNLPTPLTSFIGRQSELAEIKQLLATTRLLTLTGIGGCGKTRLAIQIATDFASANRYKHGVWWAELAALSDLELVPQTVARVFDLRESAGEPLLTVLTNYLRAKELLLVLDNCEHLIDACARLTTTLLSACSRLQILATSREALGLTGEVTWYVPSLESPDPQNMPPLASLLQYDAIRLLVERAQAVLPHWQLADHATAAAHICCRLDGIPLAIELAAARLKVLSAEQFVERLNDRFQLLTGGSRTALPRHRTLRATIDWSYDLLSDEERILFRRLAVFAGGFTLEAVQEVVSGQWTVGSSPTTDHCPPSTLDLLASLVERSLVIVEQPRNGTRYRLPETICQYAAEKLAQLPEEADAVRDRHCAYYVATLQRWAADLRGSRQQAALRMMEMDIENLRAAWGWAVKLGQVKRLDQGIEGLVYFYVWSGRFQEGEEAFQAAAARLQTELPDEAAGDRIRVWAKTLAQQGWCIGISGRLDLDRQLTRQALALLDDPALAGQDTRPERADVLYHLGCTTMVIEHERAQSLWKQSLALYRALGDQWGVANVLVQLAWAGCGLGEFVEARQCAEESLAIRRSLGDRKGTAESLSWLSTIAATEARVEEAERQAREALAIYRDLGDKAGIADGLHTLGGALASLGKFAEADAQVEESVAIRQALETRFVLGTIRNSAISIKINLGVYEHESPVAAFREMGNLCGEGLALMCLGEAALGREAYAEAQRLLQESVGLLRQVGQRDDEGRALADLGRAEMGLGQLALAQQYLGEALHRCFETGSPGSTLSSLAYIALVLAHQGEVERAVELYALATRYPALGNSRYWEDVVGKHIAASAATLPTEIAVAARERGRQRDLAATVAELFAEFRVPESQCFHSAQLARSVPNPSQ